MRGTAAWGKSRSRLSQLGHQTAVSWKVPSGRLGRGVAATAKNRQPRVSGKVRIAIRESAAKEDRAARRLDALCFAAHRAEPHMVVRGREVIWHAAQHGTA